MSVPYSAGAMHSSTRDLWKWNKALYTGSLLNENSKKIFNSETFELSSTSYYGFAVFIEKSEGNIIKYNHAGGISGFNSENSYFPKQKLHIIMLMNVPTDSFYKEFEEKFIIPHLV